MQKYFNRLLTERERIHHGYDFHHSRRHKLFSYEDEDGPFGGREAMKARHRIGYYEKSFNENLNPLYNFVRCSLGRKWNDIYSEICQNFDKRRVINQHILDHLFRYVETKSRLIDGRTCVCNLYTARGWVPVEDSYIDFYVDPGDGVLKRVSKPSAKSVKEARKAEQQREIDMIFRKVGPDHELRFEKGVWFLYTLKDRPNKTYDRPSNITIMDWMKLSTAEKQKRGIPRTIHLSEFKPSGHEIYHEGRYYSERRTASKKLLRQHGLKAQN